MVGISKRKKKKKKRRQLINIPIGKCSSSNKEIELSQKQAYIYIYIYMKSFQNAATIEVTSDRDHSTQHGLHLYSKQKEQAAKTIASSTEEIFKLQKKDPHKNELERRTKAGRS
jgi:hypothetical protein